ncbi:actin [Tanacetum coccineum]
MTHHSIIKFGNIVLNSGPTLLPNFVDHMSKEITALTPSSVKIRVVSPPKRIYNVQNGGSILASPSSFEKMLVSRDKYHEYGLSIVKKCF